MHMRIVQIWFQNRRMKDKRQRLALTWPYDPVIYAYLLNAAAAASFQTQYQTYALPTAASAMPRPSTFFSSPFAYYASLGLQRAAAAYSCQPASVELVQANSSDTDKALVHLASPGSPTVGPPTLIPHSASGQGQGHGRGLSGGLCACAACSPMTSGLPLAPTSSSVSTGLFQPYKSDT